MGKLPREPRGGQNSTCDEVKLVIARNLLLLQHRRDSSRDLDRMEKNLWAPSLLPALLLFI